MKSVLLLLLSIIQVASAQELFPSTESASPIAKNSFSLRLSYENYKEPFGRSKHWAAGRLMYGVTRNFTVIASITGSNHHLKSFPDNILFYLINHHKKTYKSIPFIAEGSHLYFKYRVINNDGHKKHFRVALYAEAGKSFTAHDVAEPFLLGDNSGLGGGVIVTQLYHRWAFSFTSGYLNPFRYKDNVATFKSGNGISYNFSLGYRAFPTSYNSLNDFNINFYLELISKVYERASITYKDAPFDIEYFRTEDYFTFLTLQNGHYTELRPAVQLILDANTRLDLYVGLPMRNKSYLGFYPTVNINFQKNIFPK